MLAVQKKPPPAVSIPAIIRWSGFILTAAAIFTPLYSIPQIIFGAAGTVYLLFETAAAAIDRRVLGVDLVIAETQITALAEEIENLRSQIATQPPIPALQFPPVPTHSGISQQSRAPTSHRQHPYSNAV